MDSLRRLQIETTHKALQLLTADLILLSLSAEKLQDAAIDEEFSHLLLQAGSTLAELQIALETEPA